MLHDGWTIADVEAEIARDDPTDGLHEVPIAVSMDPPDCAWAMSVCLRLSGHRDEQVRGNAILGFGHLARICGQLDEGLVKPLVEGALVDASEIVRAKPKRPPTTCSISSDGKSIGRRESPSYGYHDRTLVNNRFGLGKKSEGAQMNDVGTIFLLEDNPERLKHMLAVLRDVLPGREIHVEDDCNSAIAWLSEHQSSLDLISLDHDLDSVPRSEIPRRDHGCGRPVADFLATRPPTCPVIIHTSNTTAGDGMYHELRRAGWPVIRVYPHDHHDWIRTDWADTICRLQSQSWIRG